MIRRVFRSLLSAAKQQQIKMTEPVAVTDPVALSISNPSEAPEKNVENQVNTEKRPLQEDSDTKDLDPSKRLKTNDEAEKQTADRPYVPFKKKKMVMLLVYSGQGYLGMQRNPGAKTIEADLTDALLKAGVVTEEHAADPGRKMHFQRAARTDKGVSAAGQACSLNMFVDVEDPLQKINSHLVEQIRVIGLERVTKKFDCKNAADARTYMYMLPTFAFTPYQQFVLESFRITDETLKQVRETLTLFKGTHNFHNFTSGKKPNDPSAKRYIMDFGMGDPFIREGIEFAVISVKGQSFMLHQIRKMIGLTIAIVRGLTGPEAVERAYKSEGKCDIPKAPGLGLVLDRVHYDAYNKKFGKDGLHEPLLWEKYQDQIDDFKNKHIYPTIVNTEKQEKSMIKWLSTLHLHHFEERIDPNKSLNTETGLGAAHTLVTTARRENASTESDGSNSTTLSEKEDNTNTTVVNPTSSDIRSVGGDTQNDSSLHKHEHSEETQLSNSSDDVNPQIDTDDTNDLDKKQENASAT